MQFFSINLFLTPLRCIPIRNARAELTFRYVFTTVHSEISVRSGGIRQSYFVLN